MFKMTKNKILRLLIVLSLILLTLFFYSLIFVTDRTYAYNFFVNDTSSFKKKISYNILLFIISGIIVFLIFVLPRKNFVTKKSCLSKCFSKIDNYFLEKPKHRFIVYTLYCFFFILLSYQCYCYFSTKTWGSDLIQVYQIAYAKYMGNPLPEHIKLYIERYPNNLAISWYEIIIFKIFNEPSFIKVYIVNTVIEFSLIIVIANQIFKKHKSMLLSIFPIMFLFLFTPMFTYLSFAYSDNLGVFGTFVLYYLVQKRIWKKPSILLILSFIIGILLCARANIIVSVFALVIIAIFIEQEKDFSKYRIKSITKNFSLVLFLLLSLLSMQMFTTFMGNQLNIDTKTKAFPETHWLNMGQNNQTLGRYSPGDAQKTQQKIDDDGVAESRSYNLKSSINRILERSPKTNLIFFTQKVSSEWANSDFSIILNQVVFNGGGPKYEKLDKSIKTKFLVFHLNIFSRVVYLLLFFQGIYYFRKIKMVSPEYLFILFSFIGTVIFYALWENASRYVFVVMPVVILGVIYEQMKISKNELE